MRLDKQPLIKYCLCCKGDGTTHSFTVPVVHIYLCHSHHLNNALHHVALFPHENVIQLRLGKNTRRPDFNEGHFFVLKIGHVSQPRIRRLCFGVFW